MVDSIREVERAMGSTVKEVQKEEGETVFVQRRCLYAARPIKAGRSYRGGYYCSSSSTWHSA